jgi:hypothetical protein
MARASLVFGWMLRDELGLPVVGLVVNQLLPTLFSSEQRSALVHRRGALSESGAWLTLADVVTRRALREQVQTETLSRLRAVPGPQWRLPLLTDAGEDGRLIANLAKNSRGRPLWTVR